MNWRDVPSWSLPLGLGLTVAAWGGLTWQLHRVLPLGLFGLVLALLVLLAVIVWLLRTWTSLRSR